MSGIDLNTVVLVFTAIVVAALVGVRLAHRIRLTLRTYNTHRVTH